MKSLKTLLTLGCVIAYLNLSAQDIQIERSGLVIGFSAGAGVISMADNKVSFELIQRRRYTLDLQSRLHMAVYFLLNSRLATGLHFL